MANEPRFEVYPRKVSGVSREAQLKGAPEYGWRFRAANGRISAVGGEGFTREADAERAVMQLLTEVAKIGDFAPVILRVAD